MPALKIVPSSPRFSVWYTDDVIWVECPDKQLLQFPANEPSRLISFLRNEMRRTIPVQKVMRNLGWEREAHERAVRRKGEEVRRREEERRARERAALEKRVQKRMDRQEAEKLLAEIGL